MKLFAYSQARKLLKNERGQSSVMLAVSLVAFIGVAGVATDLGHAYYARQQLQVATNASALAGAAVLPNVTAATSNVTLYSAQTGQKNAIPGLNSVVATPTFFCASSLNSSSSLGLACATASGYTNGINAVSVKQTASVPLWFGGMFGVSAFNIATTATAAMSGGQNTPWNVAIVLDATQSMTTSDSGLQCSGTRESCALLGVQALLQLMYPCAPGTTCSTTSTPVDSVSLFLFPSVATTQAKDYYTCPTTVPSSIEPYTFQNVSTTSPDYDPPVTYTYQIVPTPAGTTGSTNGVANTIALFGTDFKTSDTATTLNSASQVVIAAGGKSGCTGIQAKGGQGTYYAQAIYQAQKALVAEQTKYPGSQNVMIILGDGDMSASTSEMVAQTGTLNGTGSGSNKNSYAYPSVVGQCGQAIDAAYNIANVASYNNTGSYTRVYTVGYGIASGGCSTDATYSSHKGVSACTAMKSMASAPGYFYSDETTGGVCPSPNQLNFTQLKQIFQAISRNLTTPRLVANGTT